MLTVKKRWKYRVVFVTEYLRSITLHNVMQRPIRALKPA